MPLNIKVTLPPSLTGNGKIQKVEDSKEAILDAGGEALAKLLRNWMRELDSTRSRHGSNHYDPSKVHDPVVSGDKVGVPIYVPGITRALHDIVINPVEAQKLAIPVNDEAYGFSPREYNTRHPDELFIPKGKNWLGKTDEAGNLVVMYVLTDSVTQRQDETLLPPDDEMDRVVMDAVQEAVKVILNS